MLDIHARLRSGKYLLGKIDAHREMYRQPAYGLLLEHRIVASCIADLDPDFTPPAPPQLPAPENKPCI